jgi:FKBP-type peptidyl-prolyl cis-trans isomerase 2
MAHHIKKGDRVTIAYVGKLESGEIFDSSKEKGHLTFIAGDAEFLKGLGHGVIGMERGQKKRLTLEPEDAYGKYDSKLRISIKAEQVPEGIKVGQVLQVPDSKSFWMVREIGEEKVTIDGNHPLSGMTLIFDVKILNIEPQEG